MGLFSKSDKALTRKEIERFIAHINELNEEDLRKLLEAANRLIKKEPEMSEKELENVTAGVPSFEGADISGAQFRKANEQDVTKGPIIDPTKVVDRDLSSVQFQNHDRETNFEGTDISDIQFESPDMNDKYVEYRFPLPKLSIEDKYTLHHPIGASDKLSMEQLEKGVLGGTTSDIGKEAFNGTFSEPIKNIDLVDEDGNELTEQELENALGGVPYDVGEEQFKKRV